MILKYSFKLLLLFAYTYAAVWSFNHINAWVGIALFVGGTIFLINQFSKYFKKHA